MNKKRKIIISAVGLFLLVTSGVFALQGFFGGGNTIPKDTFTRGLVGYWSFDEGGGTTAHDLSGNGNNGTLTNGPKWAKGKNGGALQFDGKDDRVSIANSSSFEDLWTNKNITVEAWVHPDNNSGNWFIFNRQDHLQLMYYNGALSFTMKFTDAWHGVDEDWTPTVQWYHIIGTWDGSDYKLYVDGKLLASAAISGDLTSAGQSTQSAIGAAYNGSMMHMKDIIDDIRIYNRALSEAEVKYHYNHGGPVAYWDMDEGSGIIIKDRSGNSSDGTLVNSPTWTQGRYGSALNFDGEDDYVNCGHKSNLNVPDSTTISAWVKTSTSSDQTIIQKGNNGCVHPEWFYYDGDQLVIRSSIADPNYYIKSKIINLHDNAYHHVSVIAIDGEIPQFYMDGINISDSADLYHKAGSNSDPYDLLIGVAKVSCASPDQLSYKFNGQIDDVKIYDYARTADEIRLDYQAGLATHLGPSGKACSEDPASCMDYGLMGYWDMDEGGGTTLNDKSGNSNNGTLTNGPKWTQGKNGGALQFDGKSNQVRVGDASSLKMGTGDFTIETWVYVDNISSGEKIIVRKDLESQSPRRLYSLILTSGRPIFEIYDSSASSPFARAISDDVLMPKKWYHLLGTKDGSTYRIYVDGGLKKEFVETESHNSDSTGNLVFARYTEANNAYFPGKIDEVRIYNRALTEAEVKYHYNHGGPVAYWDFDEGSGTTAHDLSGNGNDGTLTNGPTWVEGKYGSALSFDGTNDYVAINNSSSLSVSQGITVSAWVYLNTDQSWGGIVEKGPMGGILGNYILSIANINKPLFRVNGGAGTTQEGSALVANSWNYIVGTYDRNNLKLYINGVLDKLSATYTTAITQSAGNVNIGVYYNTGYELNGKLDDVKIYDYARTADEIRLDYQAGLATHLGPSGKTCSEDPASCMDYGLVGYWDMDEGGGTTLNDESGNGNNGTLTNGPKWTQGKNGSALQFDGKDDYVQITSPSNLSSITFLSWINLKQWKAAVPYHEPIVKWGDSTNNFGFAINHRGTLSKEIYLVSTSSGTNPGDFHTGQIEVGDWRQVGFVWESLTPATSRQQLILDGIIITDRIVDVPVPLISGSLYFGRGIVYWEDKFINGAIDEIKIYNRALSEEEIRYHYNQGKPVAYWDFDEGEGTRAFDSSDNGNHGTLLNGPTWVEGKYGSALSFDGTDDYVEVRSDSSLDIANAITVEAWVKPQLLSSVKSIVWSGYGSPPPNFRWLLFSGSSLSFRWGNGTSEDSVGAGTFSTDEWYHVVATFDNGNVRLYKNGNKLAEKDSDVDFFDAPSPVYIGRVHWSAYHFNGSIDEVKIYDYARSEEQIQMDYQQGLAAHLK